MKTKAKGKLEINCPNFDFDNFPFDDQYCSVILRSRYKNNFRMFGTTTIARFGKDHLQYTITKNTSVLDGPDKDYAKETSGHGITFYFKRHFSSYLRYF